MISNQSKASAPASAKIKTPPRRPPYLAALVWSALFILCLGGAAAVALADLVFNYGVSYGSDLPRIEHTSPAQLGANTLGVNVLLHHELDPNSPDIDRTLDLVQQGGFGFVRQLLPWEEVEPAPGRFNWQRFDIIIEKARRRSLQILLRVDRPPPWSRQQAMQNLTETQKQRDTGPPDNFEDYFRFTGQVAERYKGRVRYYQVWNEPNLESEWNNRTVEPARYAELLRGAYGRIKAADPTALILTAPLAPTDAPSPNLNDLVYLEEMYRAGAGNYFDILSVQIYGLGYSPQFRYFQPDFARKDLKRVNFNRPASIRELMIRHGDGAKPVWASEYGWVSVPPELAADYKKDAYWGESVDEATQARYLREGLERARREWPWLGVINVWFMRADPTFANQPLNFTNYFSIVAPDFRLRPAYTELAAYNREKSGLAYTGWHPALQELGSQTLRFSFAGERLELTLKPGAGSGSFGVRLDGQAERKITWNGAGQRLVLAENMADGPHVAEINGLPPGQLDAFLVSRSNHYAWLIIVGLGLLAAGAVISLARSVVLSARVLSYGAPRLGRQLAGARRNFWPRRAVWAPWVMVAALLVYYYAPPPTLALAGAALFFPCCFIRPDWAVGLAALSAPLFMHPRNLRPGGRLEFTLAEVIIVELALAWLVMAVFNSRKSKVESRRSVDRAAMVKRGSWWAAFAEYLPRPTSLSLPLAGLFLLGTVSLIAPAPFYFREALREYRLVIVEPLALFVLAVVFIGRQGSRGALRLLDFMVLSGLMVGLVGLYQYFFPAVTTPGGAVNAPNQAGRVVQVEGVTRVVSVYTHPDNLGLFLGRIAPLAAAWVLFGEAGRWRVSSRRRKLYALALVPLLAALVLSFSRGAWLATAAALLAMLLAARAKKLLAVYGGFALLGLAALPFVRVERLTSLFNLESGSSGTRLYLWQAAIEMVKDHPLFGLGLDQFLYYYNPQYVHPLAWTERFTSHPHNLLLDFWLRLGILGPLLAGWLLFSFYRAALCRRLLRPAQMNQDAARRRALALGLFGSMVAFLVHGLVDNSYFVMDLAIIFCLSFAMLEVVRREALISGPERPGLNDQDQLKEKAA